MTAVRKIDSQPQADQGLSLNLNNLLNEIARQVTDNDITFPSHFTFTSHHIHFAGQLLRDKKNEGFSLNLVANLGYIPFSAEDPGRRKKLLKTFSPLFIKGDFSLSLSSQIQMILITNFTGPVNAKKVMEVVTYTLLDMQENLKSIQNSMFD